MPSKGRGRIPPNGGGPTHLQQIIEALTEGVIIVDLGGSLSWADETALRLHGVRSLKELGGTAAGFAKRYQLNHRNHQKLSRDEYPIQRLLKGETIDKALVEVVRRSDGKRWFHEVRTMTLTYKGALTIVAVGSFQPWPQLPLLLSSTVGGIVAGYLMARGYLLVAPRIKDIPVSIVMQFAVTFAVWILAARLGLSPIITIVAYGLTIARVAPLQSEAWLRVQSYAVWDVALLVLNVLAFVLIGMQLRMALPELGALHGDLWLKAAAAVLITVLLARVGWVMGYTAFVGWQKAGFRAYRRDTDNRTAGIPELIFPGAACGVS